MRTDRVYWARLRKDPRSNWSAGLVLVSALLATVAVMTQIFRGPPGESRLDPLYWLAFLPVAWWAAKLMSFEAGAVRLLAPVAILSPALCAGVLWFSRSSGMLLPVLVLIISGACAAAGMLLYRGSLLQVEGPSR